MRLPSLCLGLVSLLVVIGACSSTTTSVPNATDSGIAKDGSDGSDGGAGTDASEGATKHTVKVTNFAYTPAELTIKVGDTVEWVWVEGTHTVSSGTGCVADKKIESGQESAPFTFQHTFTEAGTVSYLCDYMQHCAKGQKGVVVVTAP